MVDDSFVERKVSSVEKHLMVRVPVVRDTATVRSTLLMLEKLENRYDSVDCVYVTDKVGFLLGMFYVQELFNNPKSSSVRKFMVPVVSCSLDVELEMVAQLALKHNVKQVPVVRDGRLIGVLSSREIFSIINRSLRRDIFHFAGLHKSHLDFENSMDIPLFKATKARLFWLIIGFVGAMVMALYIGMFEVTLSRYVVIASFLPAIVYISDALGTQVQTLFVRDLAVLGKGLRLKQYFLKQMTIGFFVALVISVLMYLFVFLLYHSSRIALVISLASFSTLLVTSFTALLITLLIKRFKFDPALGSGPVATIISDLTSVIIYFLIVVSLL